MIFMVVFMVVFMGGIHGIPNGMFMECDIHMIHGID